MQLATGVRELPEALLPGLNGFCAGAFRSGVVHQAGF